MLKAAWFSPLPPQHSGVADYCADLLPCLAEHFELELYAEDPPLHEGTAIARELPIIRASDFRRQRRGAKYDVVIYQMGNDIVHKFVYLNLVEYPGVVVLHEPMLHHFMLQMLSAGWDESDYRRELDYSYGVRRDDIESAVAVDGTEEARFRYPMIQRVVDSSLGILVHSEHARRAVLGHGPPGRVGRVSHPYVPDPDVENVSRSDARRRLGLDPDEFLVGTFGFVTPAKRIEVILDCIAELSNTAAEARLVVGGGSVPEYSIGSLVAERGLSSRVTVPGYVPWRDLMLYMRACDVAVALRWPTAGETPGGVVRLMGLGTPAIVSDHAAFGEFPDETCMKVNHLRERQELLERLEEAYHDRDGLERMGTRAKAFIETNNRPEDTALGYLSFCESVLSGGLPTTGGPPGPGALREARGALVDELASALAATARGTYPGTLLGELADAVDQVLPPGEGGR